MRHRILLRLTLAWSLSAVAAVCNAQVRFELTWDQLESEFISLDVVTVTVGVDPADESPSAAIAIDRVSLGEGDTSLVLRELRGVCGDFALSATHFVCRNAEFEGLLEQGNGRTWGTVHAAGAVLHDFAEQTRVSVRLAAADLVSDVDFQMEANGAWEVSFVGEEQSLKALWPLAGIETDIAVQSGQVDFTGVARPGSSGTPLIDVSFQLSDLGFENTVGTVAGAGLAVNGTLRYEQNASGQVFDLAFQPQSGEALIDFAYLQFSPDARPVVRVAGVYEPERLSLSEFSLRTPGVLSANGSGIFRFGEDIYFDQLRLEIEDLTFPQAKQRYLESILARYGFAEAEFDGTLNGVLEWRAGSLSGVELKTDQFTLDDPRLSMVNLRTNVEWQHDAAGGEPVKISEIGWADARVYDLEVGASQFLLELDGPSAKLVSPSRMPVFDGAVNIQAFELSRKEAGVDLVLLATIEPISLAPLSSALGWPALDGSLAGEIPRIEWIDGVLELGGAMRFEVFDGTVVVDNVSLERPFGVLATFAADLDIDNLDLEQLTSAFEFGAIQGRLSGNVEGLRLLDWQPVAFDAVLQTPRNDRSRHRISQRAVDNLSSLGGGAGAALQQTFLRFFEDFSYDRLGLRCVLSNNVCQMSGVEKRGNGFYIVKGKGIPRIDVIGFQRYVDWPQLLARLKAASGAGAITID